MDTLPSGFGSHFPHFFTKMLIQTWKVDFQQKFFDRFCSHSENEVRKFIQHFPIILFLNQTVFFKFRTPRVHYNVGIKIKYSFKVPQGHFQDGRNTAWNPFKKPNMGNRRSKLDVSHSFPAYLRLDHFYSAFFTGDPTVFHPFVFAADAFVIVNRTENFSAEQTVPFRFECPVIDGFRRANLSIRP